MSPRAFDRFMGDVELGSNPKVGRLTDSQFRCLLTGVWALAAKANPRGWLVVAGEAATVHDVAHQGRCSVSTAKATLDVLRKAQMIETDPATGLEFCHDWWSLNPDPKVDRTAAERQRRSRASRPGHVVTDRDSHADVTHMSRPGHAGEVEGEVEGEEQHSRRSGTQRGGAR